MLRCRARGEFLWHLGSASAVRLSTRRRRCWFWNSSRLQEVAHRCSLEFPRSARRSRRKSCQLSALSSQKICWRILNCRTRNYWINSRSPPSCCVRGWKGSWNASRCNQPQVSRVEQHGRDNLCRKFEIIQFSSVLKLELLVLIIQCMSFYSHPKTDS